MPGRLGRIGGRVRCGHHVPLGLILVPTNLHATAVWQLIDVYEVLESVSSAAIADTPTRSL